METLKHDYEIVHEGEVFLPLIPAMGLGTKAFVSIIWCHHCGTLRRSVYWDGSEVSGADVTYQIPNQDPVGEPQKEEPKCVPAIYRKRRIADFPKPNLP